MRRRRPLLAVAALLVAVLATWWAVSRGGGAAASAPPAFVPDAVGERSEDAGLVAPELEPTLAAREAVVARDEEDRAPARSEPRGWTIEVRPELGRARDFGPLDVRLQHAPIWTGREPLAPPPGAKPLAQGVDGWTVTVEPRFYDGVWWIGADGFAWFPYRWSRRHELGHVVTLRRAAQVRVVSLLPQAPPLTFALIPTWSPDRTPLLELETDGVGEPPWVVPPAEYLVRVTEGKRLLVARRLSLASGETRDVLVEEVWGHELRVVVHDDTDVDAIRAARLNLLGIEGPVPPELLAADRVERDRPAPALVWPALAPGLYAVRLPSGLLRLADLRRGDVLLEVPGAPSVPRTIELRNEAGEPLDPRFVRWSAIEGTLDEHPTLFLPETGLRWRPGSTLEVALPPGELRLVVQTRETLFVERIEIGLARTYVVVPPAQFRLDVSTLQPRPQVGWLADVRFEDASGGPLSEPALALGNGAPPHVTVLGRPTRVYLPFLEGAELARWVAIPPGATLCRVTPKGTLERF